MRPAFIAAFASLVILAGCAGDSKTITPTPETVKIGVVLDQTGALTDFTPEYTAACTLAVQDENARLAAAGLPVAFQIDLRDSKSTEAGGEEAMNAFAAEGIKYVFGPRTSAQCKKALPIANTNGIAYLAPRSVSDDLSIPNDALFRLISPDRQVVPLVAETAVGRGLTRICVLYRNDIFGTNARQIMGDSIATLGGSVVYSQSYTASTGPTDAELDQFVNETLAQKAIHGAATGIAYFGISELVTPFAKLSTKPESFRTIGAVAAQSLANVPALVTNNEARAYCGSSNFQAVAFALAQQPASTYPAGSALLNRIAAESGKPNPDELSVNAYDGMRALLRATQRGAATPIANMQAEVSSSPAGTLATLHFDANGDRRGDFYGVYQIDQVEPMWIRTATLTH